MTDTVTQIEKKDLVAARVFDAPIELVWKAWTDPKLIMQWWGPDRFTSPRAEINFQEGKTSLICMRSPQEFGGQDFYSTWTYTKIVPLARIEYIHNLSDEVGNKADPVTLGMPADFPMDQRHAITLTDIGNGRTEVVLTQHDWPMSGFLDMCELGMNQCLDKMANVISRCR